MAEVTYLKANAECLRIEIFRIEIEIGIKRQISKYLSINNRIYGTIVIYFSLHFHCCRSNSTYSNSIYKYTYC